MKTLIVFALWSLFNISSFADSTEPKVESSALVTNADSEELKRIFDEDQSDRKSSSGKGLDWNIIGPRDEARELRVKELLATGGVRTGADYLHAAMILQHAPTPDDYLLAHDLCVIAISKGNEKAKWLAAASLDRFLLSVGRPQRFGTQYGSRPGAPMKLRPIDPSVPDDLRLAFNVPILAEARAREAKMAQQFEARNKPNQALEPTATAVTDPAAQPPRQP